MHHSYKLTLIPCPRHPNEQLPKVSDKRVREELNYIATNPVNVFLTEYTYTVPVIGRFNRYIFGTKPNFV